MGIDVATLSIEMVNLILLAKAYATINSFSTRIPNGYGSVSEFEEVLHSFQGKMNFA